MKIWIGTTELFDQQDRFPGLYTTQIIPILIKAGHEVVIIGRSQETFDRIGVDGARMIGLAPNNNQPTILDGNLKPDEQASYPYNVLSFWPAFSFQFAEEILSLLDRQPPPDVIEIDSSFGLPYFLLQKKLTERSCLEKIPIVVRINTPSFIIGDYDQENIYTFPEYWIGQMEKFTYSAADGCICSNGSIVKYLRKDIISEDFSIKIIPNPIVVTNIFNSDNPVEKIIIFPEPLRIYTGILNLIDAAVNLWEKDAQFKLQLSGEDSFISVLGSTIGESIVKKYQPWIDKGLLSLNNEKMVELHRFWSVVLPHFCLGLSETCIQAMSQGVLVLASQSSGLVEQIGEDGSCGLIFDHSLCGDLEEKLSKIISMPTDERVNICKNAIDLVKIKNSPETFLSSYIGYFCELLHTYKTRQSFPTLESLRNGVSSYLKNIDLTQSEAIEENHGLLSVIIPYYNLGKYINETIESILSSTYQPFEIIIVNDGSNDPQSLEILEQIEKWGHQEIKIIHSKNKGLAATRNTGAENSTGDYITFIDADDSVHPDFFTQAIDVLGRYSNVSMVYSWVRYFEGSTGLWPTWNMEMPFLLGHNMTIPMVVIRRSTFLTYAKNDPLIPYGLQDYDSWLRVIVSGGIGVSLPSPLVNYRIRLNSMYHTHNNYRKLLLNTLIAKKHKEVFQKWGYELFCLLNSNGPSWAWDSPVIPTSDTLRLGNDYESQIIEERKENKKLLNEVNNLDKRIEEQQQYITKLENERDQFWDEIQKIGKSWENQRDYIAVLEKQRADLIKIGQRSSKSGREG